MTWSPLPPSFPQVTSSSYTTANTFSNTFSNRLVMQLVRLVKAGGSADPTLTFPGKALAWETPHVSAGLWNSRRQDSSLPENRVSGSEEGNSDSTEWPRMCINTQKPLTVLCCDHCKSRKFSRGWFVFPGTAEVSWGAVLFSEDLCNSFWKAPFPSRHRRQSASHAPTADTQICDLGPFPEQQFTKGCPSHPGQIWHLKAVLNELQ